MGDVHVIMDSFPVSCFGYRSDGGRAPSKQQGLFPSQQFRHNVSFGEYPSSPASFLLT